METSESINLLAEALAKAQAELSPVPFDSNNPYYKSRYASLSAVIAEVRKVIPKHGLSIVQMPSSYIENGVYYAGVETKLLHESGQWIKGSIVTPVLWTESLEPFTRRFNRDGDAYYSSPNILQEAGKIITYLRRYGIVSILMLSAEEDIDGNSATQQEGTSTSPPPDVTKKETTAHVKDLPRPYTPEQLKQALQITADNPKLTPATEKDRVKLAAILSEFTQDEEERHAIQKFLFDTESIKDASPRMVTAALRWLNAQYDSVQKTYTVGESVVQELAGLYHYLFEEPQAEA